jgi:1,3-beta-galactosyl-N-acetylhexosamine phosphorylase
VGVLNAWGRLRAWLANGGPEEKFHTGRPDVTEIVGTNFLECLAGLPVEVDFISLRDVEQNGIPGDVDVIVNNGTAGTAWSGGEHWRSARIVTAIREWIHGGGGFVGIEDPTAYEFQGRFFQLADVLGVQKEIGLSAQALISPVRPLDGHFVTDDQPGPVNLGIERSFCYACDPQTEVLAARENHVLAAAHGFGNGRSVYLASLPYSPANSRLLHRAVFWAARKEADLKRWFSSSPSADCAAFPEMGWYAVANATGDAQETTVYGRKGTQVQEVSLGPHEIKWFEVE